MSRRYQLQCAVCTTSTANNDKVYRSRTRFIYFLCYKRLYRSEQPIYLLNFCGKCLVFRIQNCVRLYYSIKGKHCMTAIKLPILCLPICLYRDLYILYDRKDFYCVGLIKVLVYICACGFHSSLRRGYCGSVHWLRTMREDDLKMKCVLWLTISPFIYLIWSNPTHTI